MFLTIWFYNCEFDKILTTYTVLCQIYTCDNDSVVGVILPVDIKILPIVHLILELTKKHPLFYTFCQKHSGYVFASGKNAIYLFISVRLKQNISKKNICF